MLLTKFKVSRSNNNVQVDVFTGKEGARGLCNGSLLFNRSEWDCFKALLLSNTIEDYKVEIED